MMDRIFRMVGADWDQFRALFLVSLRMDFRGSRGLGGRRKRLSPLVWSLIFYGIMGTSLAGSLVSKTTPFLFSLLVLAYSMMMMVFAVLLDFGNIIINPDDADVLLHRPVNSRTYFLSKFCNLLFYVGLMGTALCLIPSFLGVMVPGCSWEFPLVFFPVSLAANVTASAFVVLIYTGLLRVIRHERFKDVLAYVQMGLVFVLFFSYQLIPRMSQDFLMYSSSSVRAWLYAVPPAWFAGGVQLLLGWGSRFYIHLSLVAVGAIVFLTMVSFRRVSLEYVRLITENMTVSESQKKKRVDGERIPKVGILEAVAGKILRAPEGRAGFQLTSNLLRRDRSVKMGVYPVFGMPLAVVVLAIIRDELVDPFVSGPLSGRATTGTMVPFFVFFMIYFFLAGMVHHRDWESSWIYRAAPLGSPGRFYRGVKLAVFLRLVLPFFLVLGILYCTKFPLIHGIRYIVSLFLFGLVAFSVLSFVINDYPFSKKRMRGELTQRFGFLVFTIPFFGLFLLVEAVIYENVVSWWITQGGLFLMAIIVEALATKRLDGVLGRSEFFA